MKPDKPSRQNVSRRTVLTHGALAFGTMVSIGRRPAEAKAQQEKFPKQQIDYVEISPSEYHFCANCKYYNIDNSSCRIVEGTVAAGAWCGYYAPKT